MFDSQRDVSSSTNHTAEGFAAFFQKIDDIRAATAGTQPPPIYSHSAALFVAFTSCTEAEVRHIIMASPKRSCSLDPVPTFLLREFIDL